MTTKIPVELSSTPSIVDNGDATAITIDSSERVGIGTSSPSAPLTISTTGSGDAVIIESTDAGSSNAPDLVLHRNSASPADNDSLGIIRFRGENDASEAIDLINIFGQVTDVSDGSEDSTLYFKTYKDGAEQSPLTLAGPNVGIGTTLPAGTLHIYTTSGNVATVMQTAVNGSASSSNYITPNRTFYTGVDIGGVNSSWTVYDGSAGAERMRINSSGKVGIGTTSPNGILDVQSTNSTAIKILQDSTSAAFTIQQNGSNAFNHVGEFFCPNLTSGENTLLAVGKAGSTKQTGYIGYYWSSTASNDNFIHLSHWGSDNLFRVYGNGQISSNSIYSDRDKKENIVEVSGTSLDKIIQVPIKSFRMKQIGEFTTEVRPQKTGFIAQEVQPYLPDVVSGTDGLGDMGIDTVGIIAHLVRAMKEQQAIIEDLQTQINEVKNGN